MLNYVSNAIKFTEHGSVTFRTRLLEESPESVLMRFEVEDTGIGIPAETQSRLFQLFEQADNSSTRRHSGTGLGLVITHRLAQLMGGDAGVESQVGVGSTFWLTARLKKHDKPLSEQQGNAGQLIRQHFSGQRILVLDDEAISREMAKLLLEDISLIVDTAENYPQAMALTSANHYAAFLVGVQMIELDGLQNSLKISYPQLPVIAMTPRNSAGEKLALYAHGINEVLIKPLEPDLLFDVLLRCLGQKTR